MDDVGEGTVAFQQVLDPATGKTQGYMQMIRGPNKDTWTIAFSNDIGRLAQGVCNHIKGTKTINSLVSGYSGPEGHILADYRVHQAQQIQKALRPHHHRRQQAIILGYH